MTDPLATASLVIYTIFLPPTLYCLWAHGRHGFLGWFYLQAFVLLRIIGNALELYFAATATRSSNSVFIINNVGLSPLLVGIAGVLHEARRARNSLVNNRREWFVVIQYHLLVSGALGLIIAGIISVENGNLSSSTHALLKTGAALLVLCWFLLLFWTAVSLLSRKEYTPSATSGEVSTVCLHQSLFIGVVIALPLVALRLAYAVVSLILDLDHSILYFTSSLAVKVCLSVVPEMLVTVVLLAVGVSTRDLWALRGRWRQVKGPGEDDVLMVGL
ncbi:hypothetical protein BDR22DRAFT_808325 [Usnea florida]